MHLWAEKVCDISCIPGVWAMILDWMLSNGVVYAFLYGLGSG